jgi:hypothetical protein
MKTTLRLEPDEIPCEEGYDVIVAPSADGCLPPGAKTVSTWTACYAECAGFAELTGVGLLG